MAFTETQKDKIRQYLGYAAGYYQYNTPLESMILKVGDNAVEKASVDALLGELADIDDVLAESGTTTASSGALKKVDEIEFYDVNTTTASANGGLGALKRGKMLIERLRQRFCVELAGDYFGTSAMRSSGLMLG